MNYSEKLGEAGLALYDVDDDRVKLSCQVRSQQTTGIGTAGIGTAEGKPLQTMRRTTFRSSSSSITQPKRIAKGQNASSLATIRTTINADVFTYWASRCLMNFRNWSITTRISTCVLPSARKPKLSPASGGTHVNCGTFLLRFQGKF